MSRIRADRVTNKLGTGAPLFPNGIRVVGLTSISNIAASTGTFTGAVSIGGTLTYEDVTNVDSVGVITARSGIVATGVVTATSFAGSGVSNSANVTIASDESDEVSNSSIIFKTDGTEKVRIGNSAGHGCVGISTGVIDPDGNKLLIRGASTIGTNKGHIMLTGDGSTVGEGPQIVFSESGPGANWAGAYIGHTRQGGGSLGDLRFGTRAAAGDANTVPTERLRIGSAGQIGLSGANYGTSGQVITSQGNSAAPQWADAGGGAWEVVSTTVLSGSTSDVQLYGWSNNYAQYKVVFNDCFHSSTTIMRMRFYMDSTSGQNGTLNTTNNYYYTVVRNEFGSNMGGSYGGGAQFGAGSSYWNMADLNGTPTAQKMWSGELIFPMKTTSYNEASKAYGCLIAQSYLYNGIGCMLSNQQTDFLTGVHIYWLDNSGSPGARAPSTGRITLLRMKYS